MRKSNQRPLDFQSVALTTGLSRQPCCEQREVSEKFKMKIYASAGNLTSDPLISSVSL